MVKEENRPEDDHDFFFFHMLSVVSHGKPLGPNGKIQGF